jgi:hypothetical protein
MRPGTSWPHGDGMDDPTPQDAALDESRPSKAGAAVAGFFAGGIAGFVLTEAFAAFGHFVLDVTLDAEDTPALVAVHLGVPVLAALAGALVCFRVAARRGR